MLAVRHTRREDEGGFPVPGQINDLAAGLAHERLSVHCLLHLAGDELAAPDVQIAQFRLGSAAARAQGREEALDDHLADARLVAHMVE